MLIKDGFAVNSSSVGFLQTVHLSSLKRSLGSREPAAKAPAGLLLAEPPAHLGTSLATTPGCGEGAVPPVASLHLTPSSSQASWDWKEWGC